MWGGGGGDFEGIVEYGVHDRSVKYWVRHGGDLG